MEGYSDSAFRQVCKSINPDLITYTEFTSSDGLLFNSPSVLKKFSYQLSEQPVIAQIFGKNVDAFTHSAKVIEDLGFAGIDLNMGCPAKKVVKSEHGVALRKNHDLAFQLIEAVSKSTSLPVSVKTRLGWTDDSDLEAFAIGAQNAGANMIAIHARTYSQPYKVAAQWDPLYALKTKLSIPLLGNGGIDSYQHGCQQLKNLDGFLIGQAAIGNPWVFVTERPPFIDQVSTIKNHAKWLFADKGEHVGCREIRKHLVAYVKSLPSARSWRQSLVHVNTLSDIYTALDTIAESTSQHTYAKT